MKLTDALLGEHGVIYDLLDEVEAFAASAKTAEEITAAIAAPGAALLHHATIEDELLFPALEAVIGRAGMVAVMRSEHTLIEAQLARVRASRDLQTSGRALVELLATTRAHFSKEENVLFPAANHHVGGERLAELTSKWASMRSVAVG